MIGDKDEVGGETDVPQVIDWGSYGDDFEDALTPDLEATVPAATTRAAVSVVLDSGPAVS